MMKKILYTVCSANHLAHCKTMADSFVQFNEGYRVIIGLVDQVKGRFNTNDFFPHQLIVVDEIGISGFEEMASRYSVIELNCAMKVFLAQYIFEEDAPDILLYLDSDMWVRNSFQEIEEQLRQYDILLTPHFTNPLPDNTLLPHERDLLRSGVYNAGFMGFRKSPAVTAFLQWWAGHMKTECYYNFAEGMGVDQVWLNLVPLLFPTTGILLHPGANVAYWNLHERSLSVTNEVIMVNETAPLLFLHISGYKFDQPEILSRHQTRFNLNDLPVLAALLAEYRAAVIENGYDRYSALPCFFAKPVKKSTGLMKTINGWIKPLGIKIADI